MKPIIIIDLEATCWEGAVPPGQQNEIIEIGICLLDDNGIQQSQGILIRPQRSKISEFCTQLTSITPEMVKDAPTFEEACEILKKDYLTLERRWGSWGDYDRKQFEQQSASWNLPLPVSTEHINLKKLFARLHRLPKPVGMAQALRIAQMELIGTHHRGGDDAYNIARLVQHMRETFGAEVI